MAEFSIRIAGCTAAVTSLFDSTRDYCARYLTDTQPDFTVTVTREDLAFEQDFLDQEADEEGLRRRVFTEPFLERAAIQRQVAEQLLSRGVLLLHGSAVAVDGKGYLFTAKTGTGKSTHTRLWRQVFGSRAVMINDDKPFVRVTPTGITLWGAPWSGKHGLDTNVSVPLAGICILERGVENTIVPADPQQAVRFLMGQCLYPRDTAEQFRLHVLLQALADGTALWRMQCTISPEAAKIAHRAMSNP